MLPDDVTFARLQRDFGSALLSGGAPPPEVSATERFEIYRYTVQASLAEVLAAAFPVTQRIIGVSAFDALARDFIAAAPPNVPQLSAYGSGLPAFIAAGGLADVLPYLPDVARLEWARGESYFAADAPFLDIAKLATLPPSKMEAAVLVPHPATRLVPSRYPIHRIWTVNQPEITDVPRVDMSMAETVLITRRDSYVKLRLLLPGDAAFIAACFAGKTFGASAEAGLEKDSAFDLQAALQVHFLDGTFGE